MVETIDLMNDRVVGMRIGGEFELTVDMFSCPETGAHYSLAMPHETWVDTGRSALNLALRAILERGGKQVAWLPAYCCSSVVDAFTAMGFQVQYYSLGSALNDMSELRVPEEGETFLYIHYFGKKNTAVSDWLECARSQARFYVIEDCVQASMNMVSGNLPDYRLNSYRKFLPVTDGALLGALAPITADLALADEHYVSEKLLGKLLRSGNHPDICYLDLLDDAEASLMQVCPRRVSWFSERMLRRVEIDTIKAARVANWNTLWRAISTRNLLKYCVPLFEGYGAEEVPLGFPVMVGGGRRDEFRRFLAEHRIYCPVHWRLDHLKAFGHGFEREIELGGSLITLPIDQRLTNTHLDYLVDIISIYFEGGYT